MEYFMKKGQGSRQNINLLMRKMHDTVHILQNKYINKDKKYLGWEINKDQNSKK